MLEGAFAQMQRPQADSNNIFPDEIIVKKDGKLLPKYTAGSNDDLMWIYVADDRLEVRQRRQEMEEEHEILAQVDYEIIRDFPEALKEKKNSTVYIVFIIEKYEPTPLDKDDKDHILLIVSFYHVNQKNKVLENFKTKVSQCNDRMKTLLEFNYLGIEDNIRKAIEYAILSDRGKREIYTKIIASLNEKVRERKIAFTHIQKRLMLKALVSDHAKYQKILIQEKIQAYDVEKNREGYLISRQGDPIDIEPDMNLEGYSEKRKMDGVVVEQRAEVRERELKQAQQKQTGEPQKSFPEELYLSKIPDRDEYKLDNKLFLTNQNFSGNPQKKYEFEWFNKENEQGMEMEVEDNNSKNQLWQKRQKVPVKDYDIFSKPDILYSTSDKPKKIDKNENDQKVSLEAVKFMYRLMKLNDENRKRTEDGPLACVLDSLKDLMTFYERKFRQTSSMAVMLAKANANYMKYKKQIYR